MPARPNVSKIRESKMRLFKGSIRLSMIVKGRISKFYSNNKWLKKSKEKSKSSSRTRGSKGMSICSREKLRSLKVNSLMI